jgi:predicted Fe-Mo cluster-binding NifX family protein
MKICIPVEENNGLDSVVYGHFGSAPYFIIVNTENESFETIDNSELEHEHGACNPVSQINNKDIDAVVCFGMGRRALQKLKDAGFKVLITKAEIVKGVLEELKKGKLKEMTDDVACGGRKHNCEE